MRLSVRVSWLLVGFIGLAPEVVRADTPQTRLSEQQRQLNLESFEKVWTTIRDQYWDPKLGGLNWQALHDEYRPLIAQAKSKEECREVLDKMIHLLGQSHFAIIPADVYEVMGAKGKSQDKGVPGFDVRVLDGTVVVTHIEEDTPAFKAGIRAGWEIEQINGKELAPVLAKVRETYAKSTALQLHLVSTINRRLRGRIGETVELVCRGDKSHSETIRVPLIQPKGEPVHFGNLPVFYLRIQSRTLPPNIGYFALSAFFNPPRVTKEFESAIDKHMHADGLILDLRGNPGGIGFMAVGIATWLIQQPDQVLGTLSLRNTTLKFVVNPRVETYAGPLVVLVDGCSASTSEILAGGLQDLKRAEIVGSRTAGAALPSVVSRLPNGDGFQYVIANYVSASGKRLEAEGVKPDIEVIPTRQDLLGGHDPALEAAVRWIEQQKRSNK